MINEEGKVFVSAREPKISIAVHEIHDFCRKTTESAEPGWMKLV
jgi:hypothetical protein